MPHDRKMSFHLPGRNYNTIRNSQRPGVQRALTTRVLCIWRVTTCGTIVDCRTPCRAIVHSSSLNILRLSRHAATNRYSISSIPEYSLQRRASKKAFCAWIVKNRLSQYRILTVRICIRTAKSDGISLPKAKTKNFSKCVASDSLALISSKRRIDFSTREIAWLNRWDVREFHFSVPAIRINFQRKLIMNE